MKLLPESVKFGLLLLLTSLNLLIINGCANPTSLSGGPEDKIPPLLSIEKSSPNYKTNFEKSDIVLTFNEYINLQNPIKQIIISPPLLYNPQFDVFGKKITVKFNKDEVLKKDATYVINFGQSIQDYSAGNAIKDFRYVFSTGDYIDSLSIMGSVKDAFTDKAVKDILVMLYDDHRDSVVYEQKPFYFASTDAEGKFKLENLRADTFKVFALKDANVNYLYDRPTEDIGFLDSLIVITDSTSLDLQLEVSLPRSPLKRLDTNAKQYGKVSILYSEDPKDIIPTSSDTTMALYHESNLDSLIIRYSLAEDKEFSIFLAADTYLDTLKVRKLPKATFIENAKLKLSTSNLEDKKALAVFNTLDMSFNNPISVIQDTLIIVQDTAHTNIDHLAVKNKKWNRMLNISANWEADSTYQLVLLPGAIIDIYGLQNDTITQEFKIKGVEEYGNIKLSFTNASPDMQYELEVLDQEKIIDKRLLLGDTIYTVILEHLPPKDFGLRIVKDENRNGEWDPVNYLQKHQAERVAVYKLEKLKKNWDLQATFDLLDLEKKAKKISETVTPPVKSRNE